jgi:hypothetical protein
VVANLYFGQQKLCGFREIFNSYSHGGLLLKLTVVVILDHLRQQIWFSGFKGMDFLTVSPENPMLNFV